MLLKSILTLFNFTKIINLVKDNLLIFFYFAKIFLVFRWKTDLMDKTDRNGLKNEKPLSQLFSVQQKPLEIESFGISFCNFFKISLAKSIVEYYFIYCELNSGVAMELLIFFLFFLK